MTNVLPFPRRLGMHPVTDDEVTARIAIMHEAYIERTVENAAELLAESLNSAGYVVIPDDPDMAKDFALVYMGIKSMLMKSRGMDHPLQRVAEGMFGVAIDEDGFTVVDIKENNV